MLLLLLLLFFVFFVVVAVVVVAVVAVVAVLALVAGNRNRSYNISKYLRQNVGLLLVCYNTATSFQPESE